MGFEGEDGPPSMKTIFCDTGPLLHLREIGLLDLLEKAGKIVIPKAINIELLEIDSSWKDEKPPWVSVQELPLMANGKISALYTSGLLDRGEAEAIVLAQYLKADWFFTDDASARTFANVIGIEVHGTLGVVLWAAAVGNLNLQEAKMALERLSKSSLWISPIILEKAFKALDEMFH